MFVVVAASSWLFLPMAASGESRKAGASSDSDDARRYVKILAAGNAHFAAKDTTAAIDAYKKATQLKPKNPLGHCLLAEAYESIGNVGEAEAALQAAYEANTTDKLVRSRVLFLRAMFAERQKQWEEAKVAWQAYIELAVALGDGGFPQSSAARLGAIQKSRELEKSYAEVRARIAAEEADGGKPAEKK